MKDNLLDEKFDAIIKEAGIRAILEMEEECVNEEIPKVEFSKEHEEKMKKFFAEYKAQFENANNANNKVESNLKEAEFKSANRLKPRKMIALIAAIVAILALGITTVGAWKGSLINMYLKDKGEYSDLANGIAERSVTIQDVYFGYVPEGYEFESLKTEPIRTYILFISKKDAKYFYLEIERDIYSEKINTESGDLEDIVINDKDMIYDEQEDFKFITWNENNAQNTLYTNESKEELIKITKKIDFLK